MKSKLPRYKITIDPEFSEGEELEKLGIVYRHRRLDTNEIFYVGIGKEEKRAFNKSKRNNWWKKIITKTDYQVEIVARDLSWKDACELEIFLISLYGRRDLGLGSLVNMTDGGEGSLGTIPHNKGKKHSEETREKMVESHKNRIRVCQSYSEEIIEKMRIAQLGKKHSKETINKMSEMRKAHLNHQAKPIIDIETGVFYYSMNEIVTLYGYKKPYLSMMLNNKRINKTNFKYA
jgi:hypothetical protein